MKTTANGWTVVDEDAGILSREYAFAPRSLARMMVARGADGTLVAISPANGLEDGAFRDLEAFGKVGALIAPNGYHHLGLPEWKKAFPDASIHAAGAGATRVKKKHPTLDIQPFDGLGRRLGDELEVVAVPGSKAGETWMLAQGSKGPVWYVADTFMSMPKLPESFFVRLAFKWTRSAPGFRAAGIAFKFFFNDTPAFKKWAFERLDGKPPSVVVTAHGDLVAESGLGPKMKSLLDDQI